MLRWANLATVVFMIKKAQARFLYERDMTDHPTPTVRRRPWEHFNTVKLYAAACLLDSVKPQRSIFCELRKVCFGCRDWTTMEPMTWSVDLSRCVLGCQALRPICRVLHHTPRITALILRGTRLSDMAVATLAALLEGTRTLEKLDVSDNADLTTRAGRSLHVFVCNHGSVKEIVMENLPLMSRALKARIARQCEVNRQSGRLTPKLSVVRMAPKAPREFLRMAEEEEIDSPCHVAAALVYNSQQFPLLNSLCTSMVDGFELEPEDEF